MISPNLKKTLRYALSIVTQYGGNEAKLEHLLLGLLVDLDVKPFLIKNNIKSQKIEYQLKNHLMSVIPFHSSRSNATIQPSSDFQRIINQAIIKNDNHGFTSQYIDGIDILKQLFLEKESLCFKLLNNFGLQNKMFGTRLKSLKVNKKEKEISALEKQRIQPEYKDTNSNGFVVNDPNSILNLYCTNLNKNTLNNLNNILIGRHKEIDRTIEVLSRKNKNNVLLVGEPGVGKTAIVEGLAYRINKKEVPNILYNTIIYSLDMCSLVSGTRYRGDFEERIKSLLSEIKDEKNIIIFIDEVHTIVGAGSTPNSMLDTSNLLKPALARGEIRCIGSTTFKEFHNHFEKDMSLVRRFQKIIVQEPNIKESINIIKGIEKTYAQYHNVKYTKDAIISSVHLASRYIKNRRLPDKAIDLIDEAGAECKIKGNNRLVTSEDIMNITSKISHVPIGVIVDNESNDLYSLEKKLKEQIFGQDQAIHDMCSTIKLAKADLRKKNKPLGCYLFSGSTGVGKTELATQLSKLSSMHLVRLDMSEYAESHAISKLIGTPPGYVGFSQGGVLTESVDNAPYSVVLFDEIEKSHNDIFNLLLQIMDYGKLSDNTGKAIDFSNTIIILTTNLGAEFLNKNHIGFSQSSSQYFNEVHNSIKNKFSQEFLNRLDNIIVFNPINAGTISTIINKSINELKDILIKKSVLLSVDKSVISYLSKVCSNSNDGVRMVEKSIDFEIKQYLAEEILFGKLKKGGNAYIEYLNGKMQFQYCHNPINAIVKT